MAIALVANTAKSLYYTGVDTTAAIDTTGANLLVVCFSYYAAGADPSVTDSKGNTYTKLTPREGGVAGALIYYCQGGTVGTGHTFSCDASSANRMISVMAFSGVSASPLGLQSGATSAGATSIAPGSVTPTQDGELIVAMAALRDGGTVSVNDGFTITNQVPYDANIGIAAAYKIQTTAAAANPSFSWASSVYCSAALATFKAETGGGGGVTGDCSITLGAITGTAEGTVSADGSVSGSSAITLGVVGSSSTGTVTAFATFTSEPLKANNGTLQASLALDWVRLYNVTTGALVVTKTGISTNGSGVFTVTDAALTVGQTYKADWKIMTTGETRMPSKVAA